ncbi:hypothetical protein K456DRAFT_1424341 [Colletotrichum gloeosporioides 23]|nr:hypothetical protein K456DRAFT_1424341 [Colletotrichum gloeosporioides 23]
MSGFEVVGIVLGVLPMLSASLKFYEERTLYLRDHEQAMGLLITSLHVEHSKLIHSWTKLLFGLVEPEKLPGLLEEATEKSWKEIIDNNNIEMKIKERLGYGYHGYMETMKQLQGSLKQLERVIGLEENKVRCNVGHFHCTYVCHVWKWHRETWAKLRDFLNHDNHKQLLADIEKCNTRLEQLNPDAEAKHTPSKLQKGGCGTMDSIRCSARSLYCALCSNWSCQCDGSHATHLQLRSLSAPIKGSHRFNLIFGLSTYKTDTSTWGYRDWHEAELEVVGENGDLPLWSDAVPTPGRVRFGSSVTSVLPSLTTNPIVEICTELRNSMRCLEERCIGFLVENDRRHYIHIPKRELAQPSAQHAVSLQQLLFNKGEISSPVPFAIELLDKFTRGGHTQRNRFSARGYTRGTINIRNSAIPRARVRAPQPRTIGHPGGSQDFQSR